MLSRFDLVFLLLDRPDAERDQRLSEHIMALHSGALVLVSGRMCIAFLTLPDKCCPHSCVMVIGEAARTDSLGIVSAKRAKK